MGKKLFTVVFTLGALAFLPACNTKAFNESYCKAFKESFLKACVDTCTEKSGQREMCTTRCGEALPQDESYKKRCLAPAK